MNKLDQALIVNESTDSAPSDALPVVVIGSGPVGVRFVQALHQLNPSTPIVLYGNEPWVPYNRVLLSSFLAGETEWDRLTDGLDIPATDNIKQVMNCEVLGINREQQYIIDSDGNHQAYAKLIIATGSKPRLPSVPGVGQANVFVFRNMSDVQALFARRTRSQHTVVIGGGLLGLEAARAMRKFNTKVTVLEHGARLMMNQLDERSSEMVKAHLEASNISVQLNQRVKVLHGHGSVNGVGLSDGERLEADTVIIAAGINPNKSLALGAGLNLGRGIKVNDAMQTNDPNIYAIGECAEHREKTYGIVAPGLEQASVAAHSVNGEVVNYVGSLQATRLKVLDKQVFSMGRVTERDGISQASQYVYEDVDNGIYRVLVVERSRIIGCIAIGQCLALPRLQEALTAERLVYPWQLWRFKQTGDLWRDADQSSVADWPVTAIVCNCNNISRGELTIAIENGCDTLACLAKETKASTVCGSCKPLLADIVGQTVPAEPTKGHQGLIVGLGVACFLVLAMVLAPAFPYSLTVQNEWHWDVLWRDTFIKQVTGFSILAATVFGLLLTFRKRTQTIQKGDFAWWRLAHVIFGSLAAVILYLHTGGRMGDALNFWLMASFCGLILVGGVSAYVIAQEHRLSPAVSKKWRANSVWIHILLFWPVPVLLAFHILKSYYF